MDPATAITIISTAISIADKFIKKGDGGLSAVLGAILQYEKNAFELIMSVAKEVDAILNRLDDIFSAIEYKVEREFALDTYREIISIANQFKRAHDVLDNPLLTDAARDREMEVLKSLASQMDHFGNKATTYSSLELAIIYPLCVSLHIALLHKAGQGVDIPGQMQLYIEWAGRILSVADPKSLAGQLAVETKKIAGLEFYNDSAWQDQQLLWEQLPRGMLWTYRFTILSPGGEDEYGRVKYDEEENVETVEVPTGVYTRLYLTFDDSMPLPGTDKGSGQVMKNVALKDVYVIDDESQNMRDMFLEDYKIYPASGRDDFGREPSPDEIRNTLRETDWKQRICSRAEWISEYNGLLGKMKKDIADLNKSYTLSAVYAYVALNVMNSRNLLESQIQFVQFP